MYIYICIYACGMYFRFSKNRLQYVAATNGYEGSSWVRNLWTGYQVFFAWLMFADRGQGVTRNGAWSKTETNVNDVVRTSDLDSRNFANHVWVEKPFVQFPCGGCFNINAASNVWRGAIEFFSTTLAAAVSNTSKGHQQASKRIWTLPLQGVRQAIVWNQQGCYGFVWWTGQDESRTIVAISF